MVDSHVSFLDEPPLVPVPQRPRYAAPKGSQLLRLLRTTDHKQIGVMYLTTSFGFFLVGGMMTLLMRGELAPPEHPTSAGRRTHRCPTRCTPRGSARICG